MRLNDFTTIDEIVELGILEFQKRATAPTINWIPARQNVYVSQCKKYSEMLLTILEVSSKQTLIEADMNPSQFIKAAQDFQLAARMAGVDNDVVLTNFIKLANVGMMLKRHYYKIYSQKIEEIDLSFDSKIIRKSSQLNGLLRAFSETIYFDDHTVSGEFYGDLKKNKKTIVVRSYKRLCPSDFYDNFDEFAIQRIETYCSYKNGSVDFDCLGNINYTNQIRPDVNGFYGECFLKNGECLILNNLFMIDKVINMLEIQLDYILKYFFTLDKKTQQCMLLKLAYYAFNPILERIGYDWHPSDMDVELYLSSLSSKTDYDKVAEGQSRSETEEQINIRRIVDPRINW